MLLKNAESLRDSDALMRVAVPRCRGPTGLRDLFLLLSKVQFSRPALRAFRTRETGGITTPGVLRVLSKRRTAACQNGSFAVSLRPLICICESTCRILPTSASIADIPPSIVVIEPFHPTSCQIRIHAEILVHDDLSHSRI